MHSVITLLVLGFASVSLADREDLTKFGNRVFDLMTSANIFDKLYAVPSDPAETERLYYDGNLLLMQYLGNVDYDQLRRIAEAAQDNFDGKISAYKNFQGEMHLAEFYLNYKGLLTTENTDFYAEMYFRAQESALDYDENSGRHEDPYFTLTWGDIIFYRSLGITPEEGKVLMGFFADEMERIRNS